MAKALLAGTLSPGPSNVPPTVREPRIVPPRGPPGAGVGTPPKDADSAVLPGDLFGALKLLQTVMSEEDFSKYEKMVVPPSREERTKEREQLLWEKVQSPKRLRKLLAGHVEQIAKREANATKQRTVLQAVREQLEAVNDEVCALRALVADPSSPPGPPLEAPLPAPRVTQDQEMENCENEDDLEWKPVRRLAHWDRRNKMGVIKGYTKQRQERCLSVSKHIIVEVQLMRSSWRQCSIVQRVCCSSSCLTFLHLSRLQLFQFQQVPVGGASRLRGGNQARKACSF